MYVVSEKIRKIAASFGLHTAFHSCHTLGKLLTVRKRPEQVFDTKWFERRFKEAAFITTSNNCTSQISSDVPNIWVRTICKCIKYF